MSSPSSSPAAEVFRVVLYEGKGSRALPPPDRARLMRALLEKGYPVACAQGGPLSAAGSGTLVVLARFTEGTPAEAADGGVPDACQECSGEVAPDDLEGTAAQGVIGG